MCTKIHLAKLSIGACQNAYVFSFSVKIDMGQNTYLA